MALNECKDVAGVAHEQIEQKLVKSVGDASSAMALEAAYFYLGGYCGHVDLDKARHFAALRVHGELAVCRVAIRYAETIGAEPGRSEAKILAKTMLSECIEVSGQRSTSADEAGKTVATIDMR